MRKFAEVLILFGFLYEAILACAAIASLSGFAVCLINGMVLKRAQTPDGHPDKLTQNAQLLGIANLLMV